MKFNFQRNVLDLHNNATPKADAVTFIFTFNTTFLQVAKKHLVGNKLSKFDDLIKPGTHSRLHNGTIFAISLGHQKNLTLLITLQH